MDKIVIEITNDPKAIDQTITKLQKLGKVDDENAAKFKKNNEEGIKHIQNFEKAADNEIGTLEHGIRKRMERIVEYMVAAFAVDRIATFAKESVQAFAVVKKSEELLNYAVINTAKETDLATKKLIEQAYAVEKATIYSHAQVIDSQRSLITNFALSTKQVEELIPRLTDIASATGKSLEEVTQDYGYAIQGNFIGLRRYGITTMKDLGTVGKNFNEIMKLTAKYTGAAGDTVLTLSGEMAQMENEVETLKEQTGSWLSSMVEGFEHAADGLAALIGLESDQELQLKADMSALKEYKAARQPIDDEILNNMQAQLDKAKALSDQADQSEAKNKYMAATLRQQSQQIVGDLKEQLAIHRQMFDEEVGQVDQLKAKYDKLSGLTVEDARKMFPNDPHAISHLAEDIKKAHDAWLNMMARVAGDKELIQQMQNLLYGGAGDSKTRHSMKEAHQKALKETKDYADLTEELKLAAMKDGESKREEQLNIENIKMQDAATKQHNENLKALQYNLKNNLITQDKFNQLSEEEEIKYQRQMAAIKRLGFLVWAAQRDKYNEEELKKQKELYDKQMEEAKNRADINKTSADLTAKETDYASTRALKAKYEADQQLYKGNPEKLKALKAKYQSDVKIENDKEAVAIADNDKRTLIAKQQFDKQILDEDMKTKKALGQWTDLDQKKYDDAIQEQKNALTQADFNLEKANDKLSDDLKSRQQLIHESMVASFKDFVKQIQDASDVIFEMLAYQNEEQRKANDYRLAQKDKTIEVEKALAEKGLANDLAYEERRRAALTEQQIKLLQVQKKQKELQAFMNAFVKFTETDPKTAFLKAGEVVAAMKIAEAVYAEEGGIIGKTGATSLVGPWGMSRRHPSGKDVLIHGEYGEGILTTKEMANLGNDNFLTLKAMLASPLTDKAMTPVNTIVRQDNKAILGKLDELQRTIADKKETIVDWDGLEMRLTEIEKGQRTITQYKRR